MGYESGVSGSVETQFRKGASGNPGGLTKAVRQAQAEVRELALQNCPSAIFELCKLMASEDERIRLAASIAILDRGLGKPAQAIVGDSDLPLQVINRVERAIVKPDVKD